MHGWLISDHVMKYVNDHTWRCSRSASRLGALLLVMFAQFAPMGQTRADSPKPVGPREMSPFINNSLAPLAAARVAVTTITKSVELADLLKGNVPTLFMVLDSTGLNAERTAAELLVFGDLATEYPGLTVRFRTIVFDRSSGIANELFDAVRRWQRLNGSDISVNLGNDLSKPVFVIYKPAKTGDAVENYSFSFIEEAKAPAGFSQTLVENWVEGFTGVSPARIATSEVTEANALDKIAGPSQHDDTESGLSLVLFYRSSGPGEADGKRERMLFALEGELFSPKVLRTLEVNLDAQRGVYDDLFHTAQGSPLPDEPVVVLINAKTHKVALYRAGNGRPPLGHLLNGIWRRGYNRRMSALHWLCS
jgi:hypothetical protein